MLALHGWGRSGADFSRVLEGLDARAIHLPGHGPTPPPPAAWGSGEYADHLADALAGTGPYLVVGHSFGGHVAVRLAVRHPAIVSSLVLTGVPLVRASAAPRPALRVRLLKRVRSAGLVPASVVERARRNAGSADYRAAQGVMRDVLVRLVNEDYREDLAALRLPVDMVWGELDDAAPVTGARLAADLVAGAQLQVVPGEGHLLAGALERRVDEVVRARLDEGGR